jgi:hypothetical protein
MKLGELRRESIEAFASMDRCMEKQLLLAGKKSFNLLFPDPSRDPATATLDRLRREMRAAMGYLAVRFWLERKR